MDLNEFQKFFEFECKKNNIEFKEDKVQTLYQYMKLVLEWNEKVNLTAIKSETEFCVKHYVDCLLLTEFVKDAKSMIDIGTGAGFPGIPLKIYNPKIKMTLIDSVGKKIMILNDIIKQLNLEDIEALHIRAEDLAKDDNYRECFDLATTRAVSNLATISEYMLPFVKVGGKAIAMKGPSIMDELNASKNAIKILGGNIAEIKNFDINDNFERNLIIIKKEKSTSNKYPRGQGKPLKEPLK